MILRDSVIYSSILNHWLLAMCAPTKSLPHGLYIALEGIDGSGKTTVAQDLTRHFTSMGFRTLLTKEPGGTEFGVHIRTLLHERTYPLDPKAEFLCFAADRAQHTEFVLKPALKAGSIVISDRTGDSSLAYQGYGRGLNHEYIEKINSWAIDHVTPDITIYTRIDYKTAQERMRERAKLTSFEQEDADFFARVIHGFDTIFATRTNVITLDATQPLKIVLEQAFQQVCVFLQKNNSCEQELHHTCCEK